MIPSDPWALGFGRSPPVYSDYLKRQFTPVGVRWEPLVRGSDKKGPRVPVDEPRGLPTQTNPAQEFPCFRASEIRALAFSFSVNELLSMDFKRKEGSALTVKTLCRKLLETLPPQP